MPYETFVMIFTEKKLAALNQRLALQPCGVFLKTGCAS
jgi:hypothetical protein